MAGMYLKGNQSGQCIILCVCGLASFYRGCKSVGVLNSSIILSSARHFQSKQNTEKMGFRWEDPKGKIDTLKSKKIEKNDTLFRIFKTFFFQFQRCLIFFATKLLNSHKEPSRAKLSLFCIIPCIFRCKINFSAKCILICIHGGWNKHIPNDRQTPKKQFLPTDATNVTFHSRETLTSK